MRKLHIYHTNDLHSHFENWPKIAHYVKRSRQLNEKEQEQSFLFDIGDHVDRFHPISEASYGEKNVEMMNELHYDAATIGNNEGITLPHDKLNTLYKNAAFPVILSNLYRKNGERPDWAEPYKILTLPDGFKIGILGVTVSYKPFYEKLDWLIQDPFESLREVLPKAAGEADFLVVLSHLGLYDDERLAEEFPELHLILGAHTHHLLEHGKWINDTLLCGAGKYGMYTGRVEIQYDEKTKEIIRQTASVRSMTAEGENKEDERKLALHLEESLALLSDPIAELDKELKISWFEDSDFGALLAKALRTWCDGEASMINAGMLLESLPEGPVTKQDLHRICPHPINPCIVELKGDQLLEVIRQASTAEMEQLKLKGLGFRGTVMGKMLYDGIEVAEEKSADEAYIPPVKINGLPLDSERTYRIATADMFTLGPLYPVIGQSEKKEYFMPEFLRDLLEWSLSNKNSAKN
ncbi:bifunctional metallophosphatase/5'-nucleotidase [Bacillus sp. FJAT-42376]|uniref:bifunctional metallophosphatase/5'-nucleotidase n=1 Tax=Bacillus sp. FJAT-42376 TaxID=2014076 RepID=UPI000F5048C3|nr:bifunctional UDP-sugar hydrolase/5'-nucleotidase [Bacillus sp. FJAT-42376]AZB44297.1 bifunctional metallophosphatase/5'-nucleotidase [Bacillus sp. FJAT-42376]